MIKAYTKDEYAKAYTELLQVLKYISRKDFEKIPKQQIEYFEKNKALNYNYNYNFKISFEEQPIARLTKILIANLYSQYWTTAEEKGKIKEQEYNDLENAEEEKRQQYNPDDLFKIEQKHEETSLLVVKNKGLIMRILEKIKQKLQKGKL